MMFICISKKLHHQSNNQKSKAMYTIIEKETEEIIMNNADETTIEIFFSIVDSDLYEVIHIKDLGF